MCVRVRVCAYVGMCEGMPRSTGVIVLACVCAPIYERVTVGDGVGDEEREIVKIDRWRDQKHFLCVCVCVFVCVYSVEVCGCIYMSVCVFAYLFVGLCSVNQWVHLYKCVPLCVCVF